MDRTDLHKLFKQHVILIPIRSFSNGKSRLSTLLNVDRRTDFMIECTRSVLKAAQDSPTVVVTSDPEVTHFATSLGKHVMRDEGNNLNEVVQNAFEELRRLEALHVTIAHGDLPLATQISHLKREGGVTIVPDRRHDGTNVISLPTRCDFRFRYGPNSFELHKTETIRCALELTVIEDPLLMMDIDTPEDFSELQQRLKQSDLASGRVTTFHAN